MSHYVTLSELNSTSERVKVNLESLRLPSEKLADEIFVDHHVLERAARWAGFSRIALGGYEGAEPEVMMTGLENNNGIASASKIKAKQKEKSRHSIQELNDFDASGLEQVYGSKSRQLPLVSIDFNNNALDGSSILGMVSNPRHYAKLYDRAVRRELQQATWTNYAPSSAFYTLTDGIQTGLSSGIAYVLSMEIASLEDIPFAAFVGVLASAKLANLAQFISRNRVDGKEINEGSPTTEARVSYFDDFQIDRALISAGYLATHRFFTY